MKDKIIVLLAEDEPPLYTLIEDRLLEEGFKVIIVNNAHGIEMRVSEADLLLVDSRLAPNRAEGLEMVVKLVEEGKLRDEVPVIFYSIFTEDHPLFRRGLTYLKERQRSYTFLKRPFEMDYLMDFINDELQKTGNP